MFVDTETTGTHPQVDRIVEVGIVKLYPDGRKNPWRTYVNPGMPIPPEATEVHGISDEMVKDAPTFKMIAPKLAGGFRESDVGGFNLRFDLQFLRAEFARVGGRKVLEGVKVLDAFRIFQAYEPRNLSAAVEHYLHRKLEGAHGALADIEATVEVFEAQLALYQDLPETVEEMHQLFFESPAGGFLDPDRKLAWRYGVATLNFGKHATQALDQVPRKYLEWIVNKSEHSEAVKRIVREALAGHYPKREDS